MVVALCVYLNICASFTISFTKINNRSQKTLSLFDYSLSLSFSRSLNLSIARNSLYIVVVNQQQAKHNNYHHRHSYHHLANNCRCSYWPLLKLLLLAKIFSRCRTSPTTTNKKARKAS